MALAWWRAASDNANFVNIVQLESKVLFSVYLADK